MDEVAPGAGRSGGERAAGVLAARGVRTVFTLCGGHVSPLLVAARAAGLEVVDVRDEATAAFAADAVARLSGVPGVAVVTAGPGVTNTLTALENARLAQSPLVLLGGATATLLKGRGALQDIDQLATVRPHVKRSFAARRVRDVAPCVEAAFDAAAAGVPGPVFVELPVDLLYPERVVREWYAGALPRRPRTLAQRARRWYVARHLERLFAGAGSTRPPDGAAGDGGPRDAAAAGSPRALRPDPSAVDRAAAWVRGAERPVLLVGSQALAAGADVAALARAVASLPLPVFLSGMARGLLGASHPRQFRHARRAALREADLVLLAGTPCDFRLDYGRHIGGRARLVSVNRDPAEARRNRRPDRLVEAAADAFLVDLAARLAGREAPFAWLDTLRGREAARDAEIDALAREPAPPVNPLALCRAIDRALGEDAVVVADGGDFVASASYVVRPRGPLSWLDPGVFGTLGVGAGFVLGVHAARPGAEIWALFGDGALGFSLAEFHTFARRRVPVIAVVGNDGSWAQIARDQVALLGDAVGTELGTPDYERAAEALGAVALRLDRDDRVEAVLEEARGAARTGRPVLVNARIGRTDFRKGAISL